MRSFDVWLVMVSVVLLVVRRAMLAPIVVIRSGAGVAAQADGQAGGKQDAGDLFHDYY
jgi:hypothetical protein